MPIDELVCISAKQFRSRTDRCQKRFDLRATSFKRSVSLGIYSVFQVHGLSIIAIFLNLRKLEHWMWYIFPQIIGLGESERSKRFAISTLTEAAAYLEHPLLGLRLKNCTQLVLEVDGKGATDIFGSIDAVKFRSCMTLFSHVSKVDNVFRVALAKYYDEVPDQLTLDLLGQQ